MMSEIYRWTQYYDLTQRGLPGDVEFYLEMARAAGVRCWISPAVPDALPFRWQRRG